MSDIFVFGSNRAGLHGAGAARVAMEVYGARPGVGEGLVNGSYAIPTKDENINTLPISEIKKHVDKFLEFADQHATQHFFVTALGTGLAGYSHPEMAALFKFASSNVHLPWLWEQLLNRE